ncbi:sodium/potassium/calcium exchanger 3-like [Limulus polyphemus]|uniref:Sodium/potassium/calcium exchanger 3-like n=1 Tax=Limulus polyphemus TaxID=6850 RepID=A0ABM1B2J6_LIMPO|nr:sodium/potassium/calcium exchanger 3-like [Limulus polyphemus]
MAVMANNRRGIVLKAFGRSRVRLFCIFPVLLIVSKIYYAEYPKEHAFYSAAGSPAKDIGRVPLQTEEDSFPDCIPPSIQDFPDDFFTQSERLRGGIVIHFLLTIYFCGILAIICDDYFVPSLEVICDALTIPSDIAGATFMAIGSSAPELFSSIIGVFVTEGDIGVGTIVGSAVFNVLGVSTLAGLVVWKTDVPLDWYPISRDSFIYALTVVALVGVINDNVVYWWEGLILILMFFGYIGIIYFNTTIEGFCTLQVEKLCKSWKKNRLTQADEDVVNEKSPLLGDSDKISKVKGDEVKKRSVSWVDQNRLSIEESIVERRSRRESHIITESVNEMHEETEEDTSVWYMPVTGSLRQIWWVLMWPASFLLYITVLDCRKQNFRKYYIITFLMSVVWIGIISYLTVWMVTIIGYTFGIPDTVSGITILAAGTSIPEVISSIIVIRNGLGNMAMCNLLGSNIFDILFCLGAPWLVRTLFPSNEGFLIINSSALTYTTATLLGTVVMLFVILVFCKWNLNYKVGLTCLVLYSGFLVMACLYELNFFGEFNPPQCAVDL